MQIVVTLRSRRQVDNHVVELEVELARQEGQEGEESGNKEERDVEPTIATPIMKDPLRSFVPKVPYLERLQAPKKGGKFEDILLVFKQVQISIPFFGHHPASTFICQVLGGLDHSEEEDECP